MVHSAAFRLITNEGKIDRMLQASKLLNQRINDIMCAREEAGYEDSTPTLPELERTHHLWVNRHFKPMVAQAYEYAKEMAAGPAVFDGTVQFSLGQFGEFLHDAVIHARIDSIVGPTVNSPTRGDADDFGTLFPADVAAVGGAQYSLVDSFGNAVAENTVNAHKLLIRYAEYPANRLCKKVAFTVNGNPLDEYNSITSLFRQKFSVQPNKEVGYNRLVGQENVVRGFGAASSVAPTDNEAAGQSAAALTAQLGGAAVQASNGGDIARQQLAYVNGLQTAKVQQPVADLWHPVDFWFCKDIGSAIASAAIPHGQRYITVDTCAQNDLIFLQNNLFVRTDDRIVGATYPVSDSTTTYTPFVQTAGISAPSANISLMELYINNVFVNPEMHDIYIARVGFSMIRIHRYHFTRLSAQGENTTLLSQLKWAVEVMRIAAIPVYNNSAANPNKYRDWHRCSRVMDSQTTDTSSSVLGDATGAIVGSSSVDKLGSGAYEVDVQTIDRLTITAHGIKIYNDFQNIFYSAYTPFQFGGQCIRTPTDQGALMINFAVMPGVYQPSGYFNLSRARELYCTFSSSYSDSATPIDLHVDCDAINFLLITDGAATIRFAT